jgi:hypothetical protein
MSYRLADLSIAIAGDEQRTADLSIAIGDPACPVPPEPEGGPWLSVELSPAVAVTRTRGVVMDVDIAIGLQAALDVLVQGTSDQVAGLQVSIKSEALKIGASAVYNSEADEIESLLYVEDGDILHPEYVQSMTATLIYRGRHTLGTTSFDRENGNADGTIINIWMHPAHRDNLAIRYRGDVEHLGAVDFTIQVENDQIPDIPLGENVLEGIDYEPPRSEPSTYATAEQELEQAPEEVEVVESDIVFALLKLNLLSQYEYLEAGRGPLDYTGGGNRLLSSLDNDGTFEFQAKGTFPPELNAHTHLEEARANLLTNSNFLTPTSATDPVPADWTLTADSSVSLLPAVEPENSGVNILKIRTFGSGAYVGPRKLTFAHTASVAHGSNPITLSFLARTVRGNPDVLVQDLRLILSFRDGADAEISQEIVTFDPEDIRGAAFVLLQHSVSVPPVGTAAVRASLDLGSIEATDDITLYLMAPQLEVGETATSRIVGSAAPVNRTADQLRVIQEGNIEFRRGSILTLFASDYDGFPSGAACLFDTRSAAFHLADGRLQFAVAGPSSQVTIETSLTFALQAGIFQEVGVSWGATLRQIQLNNEVVAESQSVVVPPLEFNEWIYLLRATTGTAQLNGELASFTIRRDIQR